MSVDNVSGTLTGLPVCVTSSVGTRTTSVNLPALAGSGFVAPGETTYFQVRYRDGTAATGTPIFTGNFTNAYRVTFAP